MLDLIIAGGTVVDGTGSAPRVADIGVRDGVIVEVGKLSEMAHRTIDASGHIVTPGFIDVHTHYDGQATWDVELDPSFSAGVTTAIFGNCGVGFAPVRLGDEKKLIELMEGVEEIPGTALHEGMKWSWSSFPEYLDVMDVPRAFDIGALLPHGPLRRYILRDKVGTNKCASGEELSAMAAIVDEAMKAGAFGLSSSRTPFHRTLTGDMTDDFNVDEPELAALAAKVSRHGGYFELAPLGSEGSDFEGLKREMQLYQRIIDRTHVNMQVAVVQAEAYSDYWREQIKWVDAMNASGPQRVYAQVAARSVGAMLSFYGINPFMDRPTMIAVKNRFPKEQWLGELRKPEIKAAILAEHSQPGSFGEYINRFADKCYDLGENIDHEPGAEQRITNMAALRGIKTADLLYELMLETNENPRVMIILQNYKHGNLDAVAEMLWTPGTVWSLSDAGAHVQSLCDGSVPAFMLTHWVRDRTRGQRVPLETVISKLTRDAAEAVGFNDRGELLAGYKADINILSLDQLTLEKPRFFYDLPGGASRLMQLVRGFRATIVSGRVTREHDQPTGELPGRLIRHKSACAA